MKVNLRTLVPPQAKLPLLGLLAVVAAVVAYVFLTAPKRAREANAKADAAETISEAAQGAARDTITHYDRYIETTTRIDQRTEDTNDDILRAPGAQQRLAPELDRAGRIALCLHDNRVDAICTDLLRRHDGGAEPPQADPARPASG